MSTTIISPSYDLNPPRKIQQHNSHESAWSAIRARLVQIGSALRSCLPTITTSRQAMLSLADGYDKLAHQCLQRGDVTTACHYRMSAKLIREQNKSG